jgi:signal transduction histidine kinase
VSASLGARIAIGTILSTALVVTIAALAAWYAAERLLYESLEGKLRDRAAIYATRGVPVQLMLMQQREGPPPDTSSSWTLTQVLDATTHAEVARSSTLPAQVSLIDLLPPGPLDRVVHESRLPDGRALRLLAIEAKVRAFPERHRPDEPTPEPRPTARGPLLVVIAVDASATEEELRRLGLTLEALVGVAILLAIIVSAGLRRAILRPVARLSEGIRAMDPSNLSARIASERAPRELAAVLERLNELLGKVEQSVQRERHTLADIAHELRTPVAGLMTTLEFALAEEAAGPAREVHARCLEAVTRMRDLIANLLALARLEAGQEAWTPRPVEVVALLRDCWEQVRAESQRRGQLAAWVVPAEATIASSSDKLRVVLANLFGNAVDHAPDGVTIAIEARVDPDRRLLTLRIANPMRIALTDVSAVFRPFWRGDESRTGVHAGLGLALAQRLTRLLGGTIAASVEGNAFVMTLTLPLGTAS